MKSRVFTTSFCTSHKNRLDQLKLTLPENLAVLRDDHELVIANLDGHFELLDWATKEFSECISSQRLKIFDVKDSVSWSSPIAKNIAHRIATGKYLFNLDADNFLCKSDFSHIDQCNSNGEACIQWSGSWVDGSFGRIGVTKTHYLAIGGYDDFLLPMGAQDLDLLKRLAAYNVKVIQLGGPSKVAIQNDFAKKTQAFIASNEPRKVWEEMNKINIEISEFKLDKFGPIRTNPPLIFEGYLNGVPSTLIGTQLYLNKHFSN